MRTIRRSNVGMSYMQMDMEGMCCVILDGWIRDDFDKRYDTDALSRTGRITVRCLTGAFRCEVDRNKLESRHQCREDQVPLRRNIERCTDAAHPFGETVHHPCHEKKTEDEISHGMCQYLLGMDQR
jgi:hypothetical protein